MRMSTVLKLASRRRRLASMAYEAMLIVALLFFSGFFLIPVIQWLPDAGRRTVLQWYFLVVAGIYCVVCWMKGSTLPMKTWGIRLARINGESVSASRAIARFLLAVPSVGVLGVGLLWSAVDREKQFLHDRWAGTRLFDAVPLAPLKPVNRSDASREEEKGG